MGFQFARRVAFSSEIAEEVLRGIPAVPGVFALRGERESDEPYVTRAADLRRRMTRLLAPPESQSKRLNLREKVRWIEWSVTGSEFESLLVLYQALAGQFGVEQARKRMRLHPPYFLRLTMEHAHPRVYSTNRLSRRGLGTTYGPFPSRMAAERYCDAVLDLFKLRRCYEDLEVHPEHPGCAYGEMKKCLAPCNTSCSSDDYATEASAVKAFFATHGESLLGTVAAAREKASEEMDFEAAAALHQQHAKVKSAAGLADELVRPVLEVRAVVVQKAASEGNDEAHSAAVFLLQGGCLAGPARLSTLGVRAVKEQTSVGSSLFAQPLMLQAVPLEESGLVTTMAASTDSPEVRAGRVLGELEGLCGSSHVRESRAPTPLVSDLAAMGDHLSLFRRWYYRPEKQRAGECFLPNPDGSWPVRRILRGAARMALGEPKAMAETQRDQVDAAKVKILHEGREGVERVVPVIAGRGRRKKAAGVASILEGERVPD
jgi:excinuclease ABC subunit C